MGRFPPSDRGEAILNTLTDVSDDAETFARHADAFLYYVQNERGLSPRTAETWKRALKTWERFCEREGLDPIHTDHEGIGLYLEDLRSRYAPATVATHFTGLKAFFKYLVLEEIIATNPTAKMGKVSAPKGLPRALPLQDIERLLAVPDDSLLGLRDRAILELLYGSGMRVSELAALYIPDVDVEDKTVHIRAGKGGKGRKVPIGQSAHAVRRYLSVSRPTLVGRAKWYGPGSNPFLFLGSRGRPLSRSSICIIVKEHAEQIGLRDQVSPHVLRHSCATHMLEGGADIRVVAEMLGHESVNATQVYTRITEGRMREALALHPRT